VAQLISPNRMNESTCSELCCVLCVSPWQNCYPGDTWGGSWNGYCRSWYVGDLYPSVVAHEIGHNFGLGHAALVSGWGLSHGPLNSAVGVSSAQMKMIGYQNVQ
jgi:hypothetical protein